MKASVISSLLITVSVAASGCQVAGVGGAFWGNIAVLFVTFGIFFGTLSLGRDRTNSANASQSSGGPRR